MSEEAILYETLHRLGIADPERFFALPDLVQRKHIEHTRCHFIGRYTAAHDTGGRQPQASGDPQVLSLIGRWRQQQAAQARRT